MLVDTLSETPSAQRIISAARTPQLELASKRYADFLSKVEETPGQGLVAQNFFNTKSYFREDIVSRTFT